jgi:hypothetical protein
MQTLVVRELQLEETDARLVGQDIHYFSLHEALPPGRILAVHRTVGTLSYLAIVGEGTLPRLLTQQRLTQSEMLLLLPLLESFPYYCPYEVLYAHFYHRSVTDGVIACCRSSLQKAREEGIWDREIRSVRNMASRLRSKLRPFGLELRALLDAGYLLGIGAMPNGSKNAPGG